MLTRADIERGEDRALAPFAAKSSHTRGRLHLEKEHAYRSVYQRDRDRIIHSTAFRRLEYKTQVFVNHEGDYYRTRLTHTLEVTQIARSIARALRINEDLVEAISLAHDIGHTPFGHSGEDALHKIMKRHGGFNHNLQGLRVVDYLEQRYPDFKGLNLTWEVREGIAKHSTIFDRPTIIKEFKTNQEPTLEAQAVDIADEIAYDNHDLDDGLMSGLIYEDDLLKIELWKESSADIKNKYSNISDEVRKYQIIRGIINKQITDLIIESHRCLEKAKIVNLEDVRRFKGRLIGFSKDMSQKRIPLKRFLIKNLYQHYRVIRMANKAHRFIQELFDVYLDKPQQLPHSSRARLKTDGPYRVICDYIAGMTDRYALDEYKKLFEPYERV